jgi:hypothetical protein
LRFASAILRKKQKNADSMRFSWAWGEKVLAFTGFCAYLKAQSHRQAS